MRQALVAFAVAVAGLLVCAPPALADCAYVSEQVMVDGTLQIRTVVKCSGESSDGTQPVVVPPRDSDLDGVCVRTALDVGLDPLSFCDVPVGDAEPILTPGVVASAFRRIPLPEAKLVIQPPNGRTLVNFATNFYTEQGEFTRTVRLLGREVELRIWPASFEWRFGDGESRTTSEPGAAYPDLQVTHEYGRKGRVAPSLDTTYAAQFRVEGGPWRDVEGTVTIPGTPQALRVVEARPVLVGG